VGGRKERKKVGGEVFRLAKKETKMASRLAALKEEVKRLACERDGIEARVSESSARLAATGVGMDKALVDGEVKKKKKRPTRMLINARPPHACLSLSLSGLPAAWPGLARHPGGPAPHHR
jgi:hypothetical protein